MNKKRFKFVASIASVLLLLCVFIVSCASYKSGAEVGKYYFEGSNNVYNLTLEEEGKLSFSKNGEVLTGSYSIEGEEINIKLSDKTKLTGTYKNEVVSIKYDDIDMSFIRDIDFTVTFNSNGGSEVKSATVKNGKTLAKPADPNKQQYAFVGWTTTADGNELFSFNDTIITSDITLYGKWSYVNVVNTLTYTLPDGFTCSNETINVEETKDYILEVPTIADKSLIFVGWALEDGTILTDNNAKSLKPWDKSVGNVNIIPITELALNYEVLEDGNYKVSGSKETEDLSEITIPASHNGKKVVEVSSFDGHNSLEVLNLPATIESIHAQAFKGLTKLKSVNVAASEGINSKYSSENGVLFSNDGKTLVYFPLGSDLTEYVVPAKVSEIADYAFADMPIWKGEDVQTSAYGKLTKVVLPKNLTRVGNHAFEFRANLSTVVFTEGGELPLELGDYAFKCVPLVNLKFPTNLTRIGSFCFAGDIETVGLVPTFGDLVLPEGLEYLGDYAFNLNARNMDYDACFDSVVLPKSLKYYGIGAFAGTRCMEITFAEGSTITRIPDKFVSGNMMFEFTSLPETITEIGAEAFSNTGVMTPALHEGITIIDDNAFDGCDISEITLPKTLKIIGKEAFANTSLQEIILPEGLEELNSGFIANTEVMDVIIPKSLKVLAPDAFMGTYIGFDSIEFTPGNENFIIENGALYDAKKEQLLMVDKYGISDYVMPNTVKYIAPYVFKYADLEAITLSENLTEIAEGAFYGATLTNVIIPASVTKLCDHAFEDADIQSLTFAEGSKLQEIGEYALSGYPFESISLPNGLKKIGEYAFNGSYLKTIVLPDSVLELGSHAFEASWQLASVTLSKSLANVGLGMFDGCPITSLSIATDAENYKTVDNILYSKDGSKLIAYPAKLIGDKVTVADGTTEILAGAFRGAANITEVVLPASVKQIGESAFRGADMLAKINLEGVNKIDSYAFQGTALTRVVLGEELKVLEMGVFESCSKLSEINLSYIEEIKSNALNNIKGINKLVIPANIKRVAADAFGTSYAAEVTVDSQVALDVAINGNFTQFINLNKLSIKENLVVSEALEEKLQGFTKTNTEGYVVYTRNAQ